MKGFYGRDNSYSHIGAGSYHHCYHSHVARRARGRTKKVKGILRQALEDFIALVIALALMALLFIAIVLILDMVIFFIK